MIASKLNNIASNKYIFGTLIVIVTCIIYWANYSYPLYADDWIYYFFWDGKEGALPIELTSFEDIIVSQYNHYFLWGGRVIAHFIAQTLLYLGSFWGDFFNTLVTVLLMITVYKISNIGKNTNVFIFLLIFVFTCIFIPAAPYLMFWITGSANYIWTSFFILIFFYPYCKLFLDDDYEFKKGNYLMPILGLLAGCSTENAALGLIFSTILILMILKINKRSLPRWGLIGLLSAVLGAAFMLLAPGNFVRAASDGGNAIEGSFFGVILERLWAGIDLYTHTTLIVLTFIYMFFLVIVILQGGWKRSEAKRRISLSLIVFVMGLIAMLAMLGSPQFPMRSLCFIAIVYTLAIGILFALINLNNKLVSICYLGFASLLLIFWIHDSYWKSESLKRIHDITEGREKFIQEKKKEGYTHFAFTTSYKVHWKYGIYDLSHEPTSWDNKAYARYLGVKTIRTNFELESENEFGVAVDEMSMK